MATHTLDAVSNELADAVDAAARSVVQVHGRRRPASGVVIKPDAVLTTARALGREDGARVRTPDGRTIDAELVGWDPATHLALLRAKDLDGFPVVPSETPVRVGHLALAIGRSWSNAVTATLGNIAVIGGPLPTGRGRAIDEVIRTTAPMHGGFAGGLLADTTGRALGIATAFEIRGLGVVIPAAIAWKAAEDILEHGGVRRGYLGLAGQAVRLSDRQRGHEGPEAGLLVVGLTPGAPADAAGLLVGDIVTTFDSLPVSTTDALLDALGGGRIGRAVPITVVRGGARLDVSVTVGERPKA